MATKKKKRDYSKKPRYSRKPKVKVIKNPITGRTRTTTKVGNKKIVKVTGGNPKKGDKTKRKDYRLGLKQKYVGLKGDSSQGPRKARKAVRKKMKHSTINMSKRSVVKPKDRRRNKRKR
tara:strand:- start:2721 stop:3077 length:357 start_codon:yes stop_codon:yes gene_type:complete